MAAPSDADAEENQQARGSWFPRMALFSRSDPLAPADAGAAAAPPADAGAAVAAPVAAGAAAAAPAAAEPPAAPAAAPTTPEVRMERTLDYIQSASKAMAFLTLWQLLSASRTEHVQLLSLLSLIVPWAGFEGAKERNRALLSVFHSLCFLYVPLNIFHAYAHAQNIELLMADDSIDGDLKAEIRMSGNAFLIVTVLVIVDMVVCIMWTRQVMHAHLILILAQHEHAANEFAQAAQQATHGGSTSGLPATDFTAMHAYRVDVVDASKDVCVICQDSYQVGETCRRLPCRHEFHANCVDQWFQRSSLCPVCNANVHVLLAQARAPGDVV
jgi:hypothetical protein